MLSIIVLSSEMALNESSASLQSIKLALEHLIDQMMVMTMLNAASDSDILLVLTDVATQFFFS